MRFTFRFRWIPFVAAAIAVAIGISLGHWQMRRAMEKEAIESRLSTRESAPPVDLSAGPATADDMEYRRVSVQGEFIGTWAVYLDNRPYKGVAGFFVLMPFKIAGSGQHVLVARGWTPRNVADRTALPHIATPAGLIKIQGTARRSPGRLLQLGQAEMLRPGAIVQNLDIDEFARASKLAMQPFLIEQLNDTGDGLVRDWPRPSTGIDKHLGYAFQWYALAAMAVIFFVVTGLRRGNDQANR